MNTYPNKCKVTTKKWNSQIKSENNVPNRDFSLKKLFRRSHLAVSFCLSSNDRCRISTQSVYSYGVCPHCGTRSSRVHSTYHRCLMDLPLITESVELDLMVRRFFCCNANCDHVTFTEQPGDEVRRYQRKTRRCLDRQLLLAAGTSSIVAQKESRCCQIPASSSTLLRQLHKVQIPDNPNVLVIGVDDWAYRKGVSYGSILIDLASMRFIGLLESRDKSPFVEWLRQHPQVRIVSRDRATAYSAAVAEVDCFIEEVADRFHLVKNMSDRFVEIIQAHYEDCRKVIREERLAILKQTGKIPSVIPATELTDLNYWHDKVVYNYFVDRKSLSTIYNEIQTQGAMFDKETFLAHFQWLRTLPRNHVKIEENAADYPIVPLYTPQIIGLVANKEMRGKKITEEGRYMLRVLRKQEWFDETCRAVKEFYDTMQGKDNKQLDAWIKQYTTSQIHGLRTFATGLKHDYDAVKNAITQTNISNGAVEGYNNKLKAIKRSMYGRASIPLLANKMYLSEMLYLHEK